MTTRTVAHWRRFPRKGFLGGPFHLSFLIALLSTGKVAEDLPDNRMESCMCRF